MNFFNAGEVGVLVFNLVFAALSGWMAFKVYIYNRKAKHVLYYLMWIYGLPAILPLILSRDSFSLSFHVLSGFLAAIYLVRLLSFFSWHKEIGWPSDMENNEYIGGWVVGWKEENSGYSVASINEFRRRHFFSTKVYVPGRMSRSLSVSNDAGGSIKAECRVTILTDMDRWLFKKIAARIFYDFEGMLAGAIDRSASQEEIIRQIGRFPASERLKFSSGTEIKLDVTSFQLMLKTENLVEEVNSALTGAKSESQAKASSL
jgi:hypothetical protein